MAEAGVRDAQHVLAQDAAVCMDQREGGVIADGADVAQVVGETLQLRHKRAQPHRPHRRLAALRCLYPAREGERIGDRAVAGNPARQSGRVHDRSADHEVVDAFVGVPQSLLQAHDGLAVGGEPEVAGFDDAGVNRADGDLMQRRSFCRKEGVGIAGGVGPLSFAERVAQTPATVVEPASLVRAPVGLQSVQVADGALQAQRRRMRTRDGGEAALGARQADDQQTGGCVRGKREVHRLPVAPQAEQRRLAGRDAQDRLPPHLLIDHHAWPGTVAFDGPPLLQQCGNEGHRPLP